MFSRKRERRARGRGATARAGAFASMDATGAHQYRSWCRLERPTARGDAQTCFRREEATSRALKSCSCLVFRNTRRFRLGRERDRRGRDGRGGRECDRGRGGVTESHSRCWRRCVCGWRCRQARARLAQHRGRVRAAGEARMPRRASPRGPQAGATRRATALSAPHSEILRSLKLRRIAQASAPTAHNGAFSDVGVPHAAGAARMRAGVGRPRRGGTSSRAHASGRASDVRNDFKN